MKIHSDYSFNSILIKSFRSNDEVVIKKGESLKYHYTSPEGLLSIVNNGRLQLTDINYFNDKSENIYIVKCILDFLDSNPGKYEVLRQAFGGIVKTQKEKIRELAVTEIEYDLPFKYSEPRKFVFCTSTEADSLCMWNYYVKNGAYQGYNIGFNIEKFLKTFDTDMPKEIDPFIVMYGNVIYNASSQSKEIEELARELDNHFATHKDVDAAKLLLRLYIQRYGAFFKHPKFEHEKEYRVVIEIDEKRLFESHAHFFGKNNKKIEYGFKIKNGILVPYLSIVMNTESVSRIYISPIMEFEIAKKSISDLLKQKGFIGTSIYQSSIPIRY